MNEAQDNQFFIVDFFSLLFDGRVATVSKLLCVGFIALYTLSPIDLVPDVLFPVGFADDGGIILASVYAFVRNARQQIERYDLMSDQEKAKFGHSSGGSGCSQIALGCVTVVGGIVSMGFLGVLIFVVGGFMTLNSLLSPIGRLFGEPATARVVTTRTIVSSLQPLGQLVSISVEVAQADILVEVDRTGINLCDHSANHVAQGVIEAGIDITQIGEDSIRYNQLTDTYTLTLPAPTITSCRIEYIRQYERSGGNPGCGIDWDNVRLLAQYETTKRFASDTLEAGILTRAERESTLLMDSFVTALTGSEVEIVYQAPATEVDLPPSCYPQLPHGWIYDEVTGLWTEEE